ncbi:MAG: FkbM family methyltransferase [Archangium sp.]|nr:FkbM family methyltransferase [Archangium sp.]
MHHATTDDVRHAYRLLLGREPDPGGFQTYADKIANGGISVSELAAIFLSSVEFKERNDSGSVLEEIAFGDLKLYPWRGDNQIGAYIKATGEYEGYILPEFVSAVPSGGVVLDVGANIGTYSLSAARKVGPDGRVFAVEPVARNVQSLCAGVYGNGFKNVSILPIAASNATGVVPLLRNANSSNGIVDLHASVASADAFVPAQRLDFLLSGLDRLDVVKIDIEGHEPVAWSGLKSLLERHRPRIFTEFSPTAIRNHSRIEPENYLAELFSYASRIDIFHVDGSRVQSDSVAHVMREWREMSDRLGRADFHHLDLAVFPKAA